MIDVKQASRRQTLAAWMTSVDNQYFAKSYVNRLWGYLLGVGIIEPLDDIRAGNPPSNPELLDWLTQEFIKSGFDVQHMVKTICKSRTYQLAIATNKWNEDDTINYSHALPRRLPAEVLFDTIYFTTGAQTKIPGVPAGTRAAALPDVGVRLPDGFLGTLGRPARESACECERINGLQLGPVMALITGPTVDNAISDPNNAIAKLVKEQADDAKLIDELYLRILNRPARPQEITKAIGLLQSIEPEHKALLAELTGYKKELALTAKREAARQAGIKEAEAKLAAYKEEVAPRQKKWKMSVTPKSPRRKSPERLPTHVSGEIHPVACQSRQQNTMDHDGGPVFEIANRYRAQQGSRWCDLCLRQKRKRHFYHCHRNRPQEPHRHST